MGAGLIQLPVLIFLGLPFAIALATHKVATVALGIGATIRHLREEPLERRLATVILAFGLPGVIVGANLILKMPERAAEVALGMLTAGLGAYSWLNLFMASDPILFTIGEYPVDLFSTPGFFL